MVKTQLLMGVNNMCVLSVQTDFHKELSFVFNTHFVYSKGTSALRRDLIQYNICYED